MSLCVFHSPFFLHEAHIIFCLQFPKLLLVLLNYPTLDGPGPLPGVGALPSISLDSLLSHCTSSFHPQGLWAWTTIRYVATLQAGIEVAYNQREKNYRGRCIHKHTHSLVRMMTLLCVDHTLFECFLYSSCNICFISSLLRSNSLAGSCGEETILHANLL